MLFVNLRCSDEFYWIRLKRRLSELINDRIYQTIYHWKKPLTNSLVLEFIAIVSQLRKILLLHCKICFHTETWKYYEFAILKHLWNLDNAQNLNFTSTTFSLNLLFRNIGECRSPTHFRLLSWFLSKILPIFLLVYMHWNFSVTNLKIM